MTSNPRDHWRRHATPVENALIDEYLAGRLNRRALLRHAAAIGLSAPMLAALPRELLAADAVPAASTASSVHAAPVGPIVRPRSAGGTFTIGMPVPAGKVEPAIVGDTGGICMMSQTGEYLAVSDPELKLQPQLAERWQPNADGSAWRFQIRQGVKFHDGRALTAADVAATMNRLSDPKNGSTSLSAFKGVLSTGAARALDAATVEFTLDAPNGNFPYLVSSDNYNTVILPADYASDFETHFNGSGPFRLEKFTPKAGASFVRNPDYWGPKALPDRLIFKFYDGIQAQVLAMQGEELDLLLHVPVQGSQALLADPNLTVTSLKSSAHNQVHMRSDTGPFMDKRVRRALALCLNRQNLVTGLFRGRASVGNDSPFAPVYAATDPAVPQREQNYAEAKRLLADAGVPNGFQAVLTTERYQEIPDFAVVIQNAARKIGIDLKLNVEDQSAYYGRAAFGQSDWLDSTLGMEDFGHRGVPNTYLTACLGSGGNFNAAHYKNPEYDALVAAYIAALDPATQRRAAQRIQTLLLDETPVIAAYFYDWLSISLKSVTGIKPNAMGQLYLSELRRV